MNDTRVGFAASADARYDCDCAPSESPLKLTTGGRAAGRRAVEHAASEPTSNARSATPAIRARRPFPLSTPVRPCIRFPTSTRPYVDPPRFDSSWGRVERVPRRCDCDPACWRRAEPLATDRRPVAAPPGGPGLVRRSARAGRPCRARPPAPRGVGERRPRGRRRRPARAAATAGAAAVRRTRSRPRSPGSRPVRRRPCSTWSAGCTVCPRSSRSTPTARRPAPPRSSRPASRAGSSCGPPTRLDGHGRCGPPWSRSTRSTAAASPTTPGTTGAGGRGRRRGPGTRRRGTRAAAIVAAGPPPGPVTLIHRDFHPLNTLWSRGRLTGIVDWSAACRRRSRGRPGALPGQPRAAARSGRRRRVRCRRPSVLGPRLGDRRARGLATDRELPGRRPHRPRRARAGASGSTTFVAAAVNRVARAAP